MEPFLKNILNRNYISDKTLIGEFKLSSGAYHVYFKPNNHETTLEGILRIQIGETHNSNDLKFILSGDLYQIEPLKNGQALSDLISNTEQNKVPYFKKDRYRYYIGLSGKIRRSSKGLIIPLKIQKYSHSLNQKRWTESDGEILIESIDPKAYHISGRLCTHTGNHPLLSGTIKAIRVSDYFRKGTISIDYVKEVLPPVATDGVDWQFAFRQTKWFIETKTSAELSHPCSSDYWDAAALHGALKQRENLEKDSWLYHLLCIKFFKGYQPGARDESAGWMFDTESILGSDLPREGAAISGHWQFPDGTKWCKKCAGKIQNLKLAYLRLAIHETLHTMGILHDESDANLANFTERVADHFSDTFPTKKCFFLNPPTVLQLDHFPDPFIRPGMIKYDRISGFSHAPQIITIDSHNAKALRYEGLNLTVTPCQAAIPLGAPARFDLELKNSGKQPVQVPIRIGLKHGFLQILVTDSKGKKNYVRSVFKLADFHTLKTLDINEKIESSVTILRGSHGALFANSGQYTLTFVISWSVNGEIREIESEDKITITDDNMGLDLSDKINQNANTTLALILGPFYSFENVPIMSEIFNNERLGRYFHYLWVRVYLEKYPPSEEDIKQVSEAVVEKKTVFNKQEALNVIHWLESAPHKPDLSEKLRSYLNSIIN